MGYKNRAYVIDESLVLSKAQALPNATSANSNVVRYGGNSLGNVKIVVKANNAVGIAASQTLKIEAAYGNTDAPADTLNKILYTKTGAQSFAPGETICEEIIPDSLPDDYKYVKLIYTTTADERADKVDAFVVMT